MNSKRSSVGISGEAAERLRILQAEMERKVGFEPSLAQIVEFLVTNYLTERYPDKLSLTKNVQTEQPN